MATNPSSHFSLTRSQAAVVSALAAGCVAGAASVWLLQRLSGRVQVGVAASSDTPISSELATLHVSIRDLQEAIRELKEQQLQGTRKPLRSALRSVTFSDVDEEVEISPRRNSSQLPQSSSSSSASLSEYYSAVSSDDDYFDLVDDLENEELAQSLGQILKGSSNLASPSATLSRTESDDILELFRVVDELLEESAEDQRQALGMLRAKEAELGENSEFLWRLCKAVYLSAIACGLAGDRAAKQSLLFEAVSVGERAVACGPNSAEAHKWYAIVVGSRGEFMGIKEKILDGYTFKEHVEKAAALSPNDHTIQHLLGRFCYEVAELSWWERKMASTLFADPPMSTMEEARDHFLAAEKLKADGWKENRQFLAKAYARLQDFEEALHWLDLAFELPVRNPDDQLAHDDVVQMLAQYEPYRSR